MIIKTRRDAAKVLQPGDQTLDFPTPFVTTEHSPVLRFQLDAIALMRRDHLNALHLQLGIERVGIIGTVADQSSRLSTSETRRKSVSDKGDFMRCSTRMVGGDRKTSSVCHHHEFRAFAPLSFTNSEPPFLATMNVPSIKHSDRSISPRTRKSSAKASRIRRKVPSRAQVWKRRWQVWYGGNLPGISFHLAPERRIQRMPFMTSRFSRHGRPLPSSRRGNSGSIGSIKDHCSSVNSSPRAIFENFSTRYL